MPDPINTLQPGAPMSQAQKDEMARANAASSEEAHRMAANHRAQDMAERPVVQTVADSILEKLKTLPPENEA